MTLTSMRPCKTESNRVHVGIVNRVSILLGTAAAVVAQEVRGQYTLFREIYHPIGTVDDTLHKNIPHDTRVFIVTRAIDQEWILKRARVAGNGIIKCERT